MTDLSIGAVATATGIKIPTIRYYEQIGLLDEPPRTEGNRRLYAQRHMRRLIFIRHARELGFEVDAIRELLRLAEEPQESCAEVDRLARIQLKSILSRIQRLEALRVELEGMIRTCSRGKIRECRILEVLSEADHIHPPLGELKGPARTRQEPKTQRKRTHPGKS